MGLHNEIVGEMQEENRDRDKKTEGVYADYRELETVEELESSIVENNLTDFKAYLDDPDSDIRQYLGENGIIYSYDVDFRVYSYDEEGNFVGQRHRFG